MTNTDKQNHAGNGSKRHIVASSITSVILLGVILVAVNYISGFVFFRADMTEEKLFTLSDGTKNMLGKLADKAKLKFYFSKSMANVPFAYKLYGKKVEELLDEYVTLGKGMIELESSDPQPDTDTEEWAVKYGLAQASLPTGEKFYLGLVVIVADKEEVVPFFNLDREEFLEYDVTRAIVQATATSKSVVGIMSPLPVVGTQAMPFQMPNAEKTEDWLFLKELRKSFDVRKVETDVTEIPADISLLMVIHPKELPDSAAYAIDQYILRGGRAIVMVDPSCKSDDQGNAQNPYFAMMNKSSDLPALFKAWGIDYDKTKMAADPNMATRVNAGREGVVDYPIWLTLGPDAMVKDSVISAKLGTMMMVEAGAVSKASGSEHEFIPIVRTSDSGNLVGTDKLMSSPADLRRELPSTGSPVTLAALVRGTFSSAFQAPPEAKPAENETDDQKKARESKTESLKKSHLAKAGKPVTVMVITDTDFLQDDYCVKAINFFGSILLQPLNDNLAFISNSVDFLGGSEDLISVRSRGKFTRTFTTVESIEREAQKRWQEEEKTLTTKLEEIQAKINQLQAKKKDGERLILSAEQRGEIDNARKEKSVTMKRRREIRKLLRQDIERLGTAVTFVNLLVMPFLIAVVGIVVYLRQNRKRGI